MIGALLFGIWKLIKVAAVFGLGYLYCLGFGWAVQYDCLDPKGFTCHSWQPQHPTLYYVAFASLYVLVLMLAALVWRGRNRRGPISHSGPVDWSGCPR